MLIDQPLKSDLLVGDWFIVVCLDGYEPRLAQIVCETISEQSEETLAMLWDFACITAREKINRN